MMKLIHTAKYLMRRIVDVPVGRNARELRSGDLIDRIVDEPVVRNARESFGEDLNPLIVEGTVIEGERRLVPSERGGYVRVP